MTQAAVKDRGKGPFEGLGVPRVRIADIELHEGKWQKITSRLQIPLVKLEQHRNRTPP
jgi:hypothetical protein